MRMLTYDGAKHHRANAKFVVRATLLAAAMALAEIITMTSHAANGAWNANASGNWSLTNNWIGGMVANGVGFTADFGGVNITGNRTITLDSSRTIGNLIFGDTTPSHNWFLQSSGGSVLTLQVASGTPTILVSNGTATISLTLAGSQGLAKEGAGTLILSATNNYGDTFINAGTLRLSSGANRLPRATAVILANVAGATFDLSGQDQIIGSLSGGGNTGGNVTLGGAELTVGNTSDSLYAGVISESGSLVKQGGGTLTLSGANTFTGTTTVNGGALRVANNTALGTTSGNTTVNSGGAIELTGSISVGAAEDLMLIGTGVNGGGALRNVSGNNTWNSDITLPSAAVTNRINSDAGTLIINGNISESASGTKTLVFGGSGNVTVSNSITTTIALVKDGTGTLSLNGANSYSGPTTIAGGVLELNNANALTSGNLVLGGGVLGLGAGNFIRALGTGNNQLQFNANGGFAAYGNNRAVNLGGASAGVTWNSGSFVPAGSTLILGAANATHTLTFQNPINFNGASRTVQVNDGAATIDAILSGQLSGNGVSGLAKTGNGTLSLTASNNYSGGTFVNGGTLSINNTTGSGTGTGAVTVNDGGKLGGNGFISGVVSNLAGGTIDAGNSVGTLTTGNEFWEGGSTLRLEINDVDAGAGTGWDLIVSSGSLTIDATSTDKVFIDVCSLALDNNPGSIHDFDSGSNYVWTIATTATGIFFKPGESESTVFDVLMDELQNSTDGGTFHLALANGGNDLNLVFTSALNQVPEPGVSAIILCGLAGLMVIHRLRRSTMP